MQSATIDCDAYCMRLLILALKRNALSRRGWQRLQLNRYRVHEAINLPAKSDDKNCLRKDFRMACKIAKTMRDPLKASIQDEPFDALLKNDTPSEDLIASQAYGM